jgi:UDP-3-O-[3-hydroxymyristoyl] N-acetylglucosamine deacetylase/3-hydroxyacyl-[acyl-carrier-protein] dehydratase
MRKYRYDIQDILKIMPHRYPFLLVDRILEPFFAGHFPGEPVMPGVLIIEAMAQVGGFLLLNRVDSTEDKLLFFMMIDKVKFRKPVRPGDQLRSEVTMKRFRKKLCVIEGRAFVDDELVAEGEFTAMIMEKGKDGEDGQDS